MNQMIQSALHLHNPTQLHNTSNKHRMLWPSHFKFQQTHPPSL